MSDDLVERLYEYRDRIFIEDCKAFGLPIFGEAADRIEKLEAALWKIETLELDPRNSGQMWVEALRQIARKALGEKTDD
jgi:hypothetical protein